jgi:hypothetical protein
MKAVIAQNRAHLMIRSRTFKGGAPTGIVNQTVKGKDFGGKEGKYFHSWLN